MRLPGWIFRIAYGITDNYVCAAQASSLVVEVRETMVVSETKKLPSDMQNRLSWGGVVANWLAVLFKCINI